MKRSRPLCHFVALSLRLPWLLSFLFAFFGFRWLRACCALRLLLLLLLRLLLLQLKLLEAGFFSWMFFSSLRGVQSSSDSWYCVVNIQFDLRLLALLNWYCAPGGDPGAPKAQDPGCDPGTVPPWGVPPLVATLAPTLVPPWRRPWRPPGGMLSTFTATCKLQPSLAEGLCGEGLCG